MHRRKDEVEPGSQHQASAEMAKTIHDLESFVDDPHIGLPEPIFRFISRIAPLVNVDLLIKDDSDRTLLTWRDDGYSPLGWHVPGGIVRFKETLAGRTKAVARIEPGAEVAYDPIPLTMKETIHPSRKERGHFLSLLYSCRLASQPNEDIRCRDNTPNRDQWKWYQGCPRNILDVREVYREFRNIGAAMGEHL